MALPCNTALKKAVDSLLCSLCYIHPSYFSLLMSWIGVISPSGGGGGRSPVQHHHLSITDDGKKQQKVTDHSKHAARPPVSLSEAQLSTLAAASQSPQATQQLLDSGLPSLLARSLTQFCLSFLASADLPMPAAPTERRSPPQQPPPLAAELAAPVLRFLTEVGGSHIMKDWLGRAEVNPLWAGLLFLLCHSSASAGSQAPPPAAASPAPAGRLTTQQRTALENTAVAFFLQCISCHPGNQRLMAQVSLRCPRGGGIPPQALTVGKVSLENGKRPSIAVPEPDESIRRALRRPGQCPPPPQ